MSRFTRASLGYVFAAAAVGAAVELTHALWAWINPNIGSLFFAAVVASAWVGGLGPALLATALASLASTYALPTQGNAPGFDMGDLLRAATFLVVGVLVSWLNAARARAQRALEETRRLDDELRRRAGDLERANRRLEAEAAERERAQQDLLAHRESLRKLARELGRTEERERRQLASRLHDGVGQTLATAKIRLDIFRQTRQEESVAPTGVRDGAAAARAPAPAPAPRGPSVTEAVGEVMDLLDGAIAQARTLTHDLSPPILYEGRFESALEWLADRMRRQHGLAVSVTTAPDEPAATGPSAGGRAIARPPPPLAVPQDLRVFLFQAIRELLFNVVKHANATHARVTIAAADDGTAVRVRVEDDGRGIDPAATDGRTSRNEADGGDGRDGGGGGFGLFHIRERLDDLGGRFAAEPRPGGGTRVWFTLPVGPAAAGAAAKPPLEVSDAPTTR